MESLEEFEHGASFAFYAGRRILMVQRQGLPRFCYPVAPPQNYLISPARLQELWQGPNRLFLLVDDASPLEPYLENARVALRGTGKRLLVNRPVGMSPEDSRSGPSFRQKANFSGGMFSTRGSGSASGIQGVPQYK
jgi:hypothetical protein